MAASAPCRRWPAPNAALARTIADRAAAQPPLEPMQDERPLHLLAYASGDDDHSREHERLPRRTHHRFKRIVRDGVQPWREARQRQHDDDAEPERDERHRQPGSCLGAYRPASKKHLSRTLAVGDQQERR